VYKNGGVEVIANEQGNRATPCYIGFTAKERVVGEAGRKTRDCQDSDFALEPCSDASVCVSICSLSVCRQLTITSI
jgi:molecular chaperone DnaK (HSP70)